MGEVIFGLVCGCGALTLVLLTASALLRLAVSITNNMVGPARPTAAPRAGGGIPEWDWDDWDDEGAAPARPRRIPKAIPDPGLGKGAAIMFVTAVVFGLGFVLTGFGLQEIGFRMWREETRLAVLLLNLPVAGSALTVLLVLTLPTTSWRAAMVAFVYGLLVFAFVVFVGALVFVVAVAVR